MKDPSASQSPLHAQHGIPTCNTLHPLPSRTKHTKYGIASGGTILTMTEELSRSNDSTADWVLSRHLQSTYIDSFLRIDRLDGIAIPSAKHNHMLEKIHLRYMRLCAMSERASIDALWVPGLEPSHEWGDDDEALDHLGTGSGLGKETFDAADMYARIGVRRGICLGMVQDRNGWERTLWELPRAEGGDAKYEDPVKALPCMLCRGFTGRNNGEEERAGIVEGVNRAEMGRAAAGDMVGAIDEDCGSDSELSVLSDLSDLSALEKDIKKDEDSDSYEDSVVDPAPCCQSAIRKR